MTLHSKLLRQSPGFGRTRTPLNRFKCEVESCVIPAPAAPATNPTAITRANTQDGTATVGGHQGDKTTQACDKAVCRASVPWQSWAAMSPQAGSIIMIPGCWVGYHQHYGVIPRFHSAGPRRTGGTLVPANQHRGTTSTMHSLKTSAAASNSARLGGVTGHLGA